MAACCQQTPMLLVQWLFLLLCMCIYLVSTEYKLKDIEFNFKPGEPLPKIFSADEIAQYDGSDPNKPIYMSVKGVVFDVSSGKTFYGKDSSYNALVGKDASRGVAKMSLESEDLTHDLTGLNPDTLQSLDDIFEGTYKAKYPVVGYMDYVVEQYPGQFKSNEEL